MLKKKKSIRLYMGKKQKKIWEVGEREASSLQLSSLSSFINN